MTILHFAAHRASARHGLPSYPAEDWVRRVAATVREWRRRRYGRHQLLALDERTLKDIGITRAEALVLGRKPFWKE